MKLENAGIANGDRFTTHLCYVEFTFCSVYEGY